jgi:hypothetical protein
MDHSHTKSRVARAYVKIRTCNGGIQQIGFIGIVLELVYFTQHDATRLQFIYTIFKKNFFIKFTK